MSTTLKRTKTVEERIIRIDVAHSTISLEVFYTEDGVARSKSASLTVKEARKLRKQLSQAIDAAEGASNPF